MTHNFSSPFLLEQTCFATVTKLLFKVKLPYADAAVTGRYNLFYEVYKASSHFTASNLSAPTKYILAEANRWRRFRHIISFARFSDFRNEA
jgi:hypothetical protein